MYNVLCTYFNGAIKEEEIIPVEKDPSKSKHKNNMAKRMEKACAKKSIIDDINNSSDTATQSLSELIAECEAYNKQNNSSNTPQSLIFKLCPIPKENVDTFIRERINGNRF